MKNFLNKLFDVTSVIFIFCIIVGLIVSFSIALNAKTAKYNHELYESYVRVTGNPKNIQEVDFIRLKDAKLIKIE